MKFKIFIYAVVTLVTCLSCNAQDKVKNSNYEFMLQSLLRHNVSETTVDSISKDTSPIIFLDAREKPEYKVSHLKDAIWVGYDTFTMSKVKGLDKNARVVVYCSVGYRSEKITEKLQKKGFTNVSNLYGGLFEWKNQGYTIFDSSNNETERVHAFDKSWGIWLEKGIKVYK